jgi:hypothetical protein
MPWNDRSQRDLVAKLRSTLGPDEADTLMSMFPPHGWDQFATKADLVELRTELRSELKGLKHELTADFRKEIIGQTRTIIFAVVGILIPYAGVIFAAARLG